MKGRFVTCLHRLTSTVLHTCIHLPLAYSPLYSLLFTMGPSILELSHTTLSLSLSLSLSFTFSLSFSFTFSFFLSQ